MTEYTLPMTLNLGWVVAIGGIVWVLIAGDPDLIDAAVQRLGGPGLCEH